MPNLLHQFLHEGNVQARPFLGELFDFGIQAGLTGFFTPTDEKLAFELTGYMDEIDVAVVADLDQFDAGNEPEVKDLMHYQGYLYSVRTLKTDQSAYVIGLKMLGPIGSAPGYRTQVFTVDLDQGDTSKAITFPTAFTAEPRGVYVSLISPAGGSVFFIAVDGSTLDETGFTEIFGAAVPAAGYQLKVIAVL